MAQRHDGCRNNSHKQPTKIKTVSTSKICGRKFINATVEYGNRPISKIAKIGGWRDHRHVIHQHHPKQKVINTATRVRSEMVSEPKIEIHGFAMMVKPGGNVSTRKDDHISLQDRVVMLRD